MIPNCSPMGVLSAVVDLFLQPLCFMSDPNVILDKEIPEAVRIPNGRKITRTLFKQLCGKDQGAPQSCMFLDLQF